ncbi:MAG: DUF308 domain-containing protein [Acidimicrobiia bacterium]
MSSDHSVNYAFLLGGLIAAIFGIILLIRQEEALGLLAVLLGLWWLVQGAFMLFSVFVDREDIAWKLILGVLGLVAGVAVLSNPVDSAQLLGSGFAVFLGVMGLLIGIGAIFGGFRGGGVGSLAFGAVSALIGLLFILNPSVSLSVMVTLFAVLLLLDGVVGVYLGLRLR